jgi:hypothetical protein
VHIAAVQGQEKHSLLVQNATAANPESYQDEQVGACGPPAYCASQAEAAGLKGTTALLPVLFPQC